MSISEVEAIPLATELDISADELTVTLADGRRVSVPLAWFPRLLDATAEELADFRFLGAGEGIHWPQLDEDISVSSLLRGAPATRLPLREPSVDRAEQTSHTIRQYRRSEHGDTWHWCVNCSTYPTSDYFVRSSRPDGVLCNECESKTRSGNC